MFDLTSAIQLQQYVIHSFLDGLHSVLQVLSDLKETLLSKKLFLLEPFRLQFFKIDILNLLEILKFLLRFLIQL